MAELFFKTKNKTLVNHYLLVILIYGTNPLAQALGCSGSSSNLFWFKVWVGNVFIADDSYGVCWDVVPVILMEALKKPYVSQELFGRAPIVFYFFTST